MATGKLGLVGLGAAGRAVGEHVEPYGAGARQRQHIHWLKQLQACLDRIQGRYRRAGHFLVLATADHDQRGDSPIHALFHQRRPHPR
jgi:hypothetical protein